MRILFFVIGFTRSIVLFNQRFANLLQNHGNHSVSIANLVYSSDSWNLDYGSIERFDFVNENIHALAEKMRYLTILWHSKFMANFSRATLQVDAWGTNPINYTNTQTFAEAYHKLSLIACRDMIDNLTFIDWAASKNFDLILAHIYDFCPLAFSELLKLPVLFHSGGNYIFDHVAEVLNLPHPPSYVPSSLTSYSDSLTFYERMKNAAVVATNPIPRRSRSI